MYEEWLVVGTFIGAGASGLIAYGTIRYSKRQHERTAMKDIFEMLNNDTHKAGEINILVRYNFGDLMVDDKINPAVEDWVKIVWRNYDQAGLLVTNNLVPKNAYYKMFGKVTIIAYHMLREEILRRRNESPEFMMYFEELAKDCFTKQWKGLVTDPRTKRQITHQDLGISTLS